MLIDNSEIILLGGTGSMGSTLVRLLKKRYKPKGIRIYSRDELKQWNLKQELEHEGLAGQVSFLIGDVRDKQRLDRAMRGVDIIFNLAAMKQVPACEYNPEEPIKTNIIGAMNIMDCAIDNKVKVCMHVSTDKCVYAVNIYGATKLVAEKLFLHGNVYAGPNGTKFSCCRYGNVLGSRGSIIPLFKKQRESGVITITHPDMTRFWIKLHDVAEFIIQSAQETIGAEIFIPRMPSMKITDLADVIAPECEQKFIGIRQGEKLHECLIAEEESTHTLRNDNRYIIRPTDPEIHQNRFMYTSLNNDLLLSKDQLRTMLEGGLYD